MVFSSKVHSTAIFVFFQVPLLAGHTMTIVGDIIFVIGGAAGTFNDVVYTFELSRNRWTPSWPMVPGP